MGIRLASQTPDELEAEIEAEGTFCAVCKMEIMEDPEGGWTNGDTEAHDHKARPLEKEVELWRIGLLASSAQPSIHPSLLRSLLPFPFPLPFSVIFCQRLRCRFRACASVT